MVAAARPMARLFRGPCVGFGPALVTNARKENDIGGGNYPTPRCHLPGP